MILDLLSVKDDMMQEEQIKNVERKRKIKRERKTGKYERSLEFRVIIRARLIC